MTNKNQIHIDIIPSYKDKKAYAKYYREKNKEKIRNHQKKYENKVKNDPTHVEKRRCLERERYAKNPQKYKDRNQKIYYQNQSKNQAYAKRYYSKHKKQYAQYYINNKTLRLEQIKKYAQTKKYKDYLKNYRKTKGKEREKERVVNDDLYRAKKCLRSVVSSSFSRIKKNKPTNTLQLLGCTWEEAKKHFENLFQEGMTWENHGRGFGKWQVDHIRPVSDWKNKKDLHMMNHISNLQPLWFEDNQKKKDKLTEVCKIVNYC